MDKNIVSKRFKDLANAAYTRNYPVFSDFLDLAEQAEYFRVLNDKGMPPVKSFLNGGLIFDDKGNNEKEAFLERKIACFYPIDWETEIEIPVSVIKITPVNMKFAGSINHRDFLGALMNLGIERCLLGDIIVRDNTAYVFVLKKMCDYIINTITRIKHTTVNCEICNNCDISLEPVFKEEKGSVASERIDAIISFAFNMSRSEAGNYISAGKVFVEGIEINSKSHMLKYGNIVSVRGKGRFIFDEIISTTKKGRYFIKIRKYI